MQKPRLHLLLAALIAFVVGLGLPEVHSAEGKGDNDVIAKVEKTLHVLIKALVANDYAAFITPGTKDLSTRISDQRFALMREDAAASLKNGYTVAFDIEVPEGGGSIGYHWKITPRKGDELHAILVLKGDKVFDLSLQ